MTSLPTWSTVVDLFADAYERHSTASAVSDSRRRLTYGELRQESNRLANAVAATGAVPGDRVVVVTSNRVEFVVADHALARGGFIRTALSDRLHPAEVASIVQDCAPALAILEESWLRAAGEDYRASLACDVVVVGEMPPDTESGDRLTRGYADFVACAPEEDPAWGPSPSDPVWLMYTSGSTGKPKGVVHTHRSISAMATNILWALPGAGEEEVVLHSAPLAHLSGAVAIALTGLAAHHVLVDKFEPAAILGVIDRARVTVAPLVPTQLNMLTDHLEEHPDAAVALRAVPYAGSAISPDRLAKARLHFGEALVQLYGATEVPMPMTALFPVDHVDVQNAAGLPRFASAGVPAPGVEVTIRDAADEHLPPGEPGEIVVRSPAACRGYWNNPEATAELFDPDGFVRTGDVGLVDEHGYLFIVDRKKDMIVSGGFNVYPREVENALSTMPGVAEVTVVSAPSTTWGESVVAVVVPLPGVELTLEGVQTHCRALLAGYKLPRQLEVVESLPRGSTGKIAKKAVADRFWEGSRRRVGG